MKSKIKISVSRPSRTRIARREIYLFTFFSFLFYLFVRFCSTFVQQMFAIGLAGRWEAYLPFSTNKHGANDEQMFSKCSADRLEAGQISALARFISSPARFRAEIAHKIAGLARFLSGNEHPNPPGDPGTGSSPPRPASSCPAAQRISASCGFPGARGASAA